MSKDDGGFVYPLSGGGIGKPTDNKGITRRDWLAGLAMQGHIANANKEFIKAIVDCANENGITEAEMVSAASYEIADAMIAESRKP